MTQPNEIDDVDDITKVVCSHYVEKTSKRQLLEELQEIAIPRKDAIEKKVLKDWILDIKLRIMKSDYWGDTFKTGMIESLEMLNDEILTEGKE